MHRLDIEDLREVLGLTPRRERQNRTYMRMARGLGAVRLPITLY
jgi:hypothetical protein